MKCRDAARNPVLVPILLLTLRPRVSSFTASGEQRCEPIDGCERQSGEDALSCESTGLCSLKEPSVATNLPNVSGSGGADNFKHKEVEGWI
ncbi:hypothetical protein VZT92_017909 [Zoarces viviparus]|uniref:Uncharacterized protein n=1 Tax=Zoarces viviparus TaxID=48416 RepID=A0AAW1ENT1_ZOAVI